MGRTIHAIAAGTAVICFTVFGTALTRAATWSAAVDDEALENDDASPTAIVDQDRPPSLALDEDPTHSFHWTSDVTLAAPPYAVEVANADAPSASSTAIPLPPAVWTGFASLAALGTIPYLRRLRLRR